MTTSEPSSDLPKAVPALWRTFRIGYRAEPRLLLLSLGTTLLMMLPDTLLALWLKLLTDGLLDGRRTPVIVAAIGLAVSAVATWIVGVFNERVGRALPRPPGDRHGVAHRPPAGDGGDDRAPGAPGVPRSPRRAPRHVVHARPPLPVAAHEPRLGGSASS